MVELGVHSKKPEALFVRLREEEEDGTEALSWNDSRRVLPRSARQLPARDGDGRGGRAYIVELRPCRRVLPRSARQLPARDVLENLPIFRCQTRASFRSRAARACALPASLSLLFVS